MNNLQQFHATVKEVYESEKRAGNVPAQHIRKYDNLVDCPAIIEKDSRRILVHRLWRNRVARMYQRDQGLKWSPPNAIDWEDIRDWLRENIVTIIKVLAKIVPFLGS